MPSERPDSTPVQRDGARERLVLTKKWAYLLLSAVFLPLSQENLERELLGLFDAVCAAVRGEPFNSAPAREAGARLVELGCTGEEALPRTMAVLGKGLLSWWEFQPVDRFAERVVLGLGALAAGFAEANRRATFEQQQDMNLSMLKAVRDAKWHLLESEARFDEVAMSSASGIIITDVDGRLVRVNAAVGEMLGYTAEELTGIDLFDIVHPDYAPVLRVDYQALLAGSRERIKQSQLLLCKNSDIARISLTATLLRGADDRPSQFVTVVEDGTELLLLQSELSRQALHDALTGLPNRQSFGTQVESALRRADPVRGVTLFHLDLDSFAVLCDGLGRRVGERLLVEVARRLKTAVANEKAMVARFDGDEFAILVENTASTPSVGTVVSNINEQLARPIHVDGRELAVSASIGVMHRPEPCLEFDEVLRAADVALRRAKAAGRAQWRLFHPDQDARDREAHALAGAMHGAWETGEIDVVYQPVTDLADGRVEDVQALLRWRRPGTRPLPHERCVALADMTGLILPLGEWLLRGASRDTKWWRQRFTGDLSLAIGLTANQSSDADLVSRVVGVLDDTGLPPEGLTLWLPVAALPTPEVTDNLRILADVGVRTGLDGFGTAPSELASLEDLPVRSVRLAHGLVERQAHNDSDSPLVTALRDVGPLVRRAGAELVIDGVRTRAQADWWRGAGAHSGTGDLFGAARPADEMATQLGKA